MSDPAGDASGAPLLASIEDPADLRRLAPGQLPQLASELRSFLIQSVARSGGHLAAGLGTVELTIALHYLFDTPTDTLVWDIGHQAYPHKVLTGRRERLNAVRRKEGLSGFLRREESPYDAFGAGHSSTSISAALGMAIANAQHRLPAHTVAIIGDGALTAGMAYEALNHAGALGANLLVILNDNGMSISPNVGALSESLRRQRERVGARHSHGAGAQSSVAALFEQLGFHYAGPVDGHDLPALLQAVAEQKDAGGPRVLHVVTQKGHGYAPAEADPIAYHGVAAFDPAHGLGAPVAGGQSSVTLSQVFGDWLCEAAQANPELVAITPAMREGSCLAAFAARFPERYFDVGIAEQHSVTLAAGLACRGMRPVVAIYSTFLQRAYDQLIHDVCIQKLPVLFALDRAGLVGPDGATHNGSFDLSYLRCLPGMVVMMPADGVELRNMLQTALSIHGPVAVRYPRASVSAAGLERPAVSLPLGSAELRRSGRQVALLSFGALLPTCLRVAESLHATVANMRFLKPLDVSLVQHLARTHGLIVTVEDNALAGGAGSAVAECLAASGLCVPLLQLGLPDRFLEHGSREQSLQEAGLDLQSMLNAIRLRLAGLSGSKREPGLRARGSRQSSLGTSPAHDTSPQGRSGALMR
jgi:1-deoxy-D-xylulose-5-phosphate synthase